MTHGSPKTYSKSCTGLAERCAGFQLDTADECNVQYYLYCERLFKPAGKGSEGHSWCPSPPGYPRHCCYAKEVDERRRATRGAQGQRRGRRQPEYLLQVVPQGHHARADDG